ncbi:MAG: HlyC/CorC family transporter [Dehalococcoidia bacterium]|nr:MAG: HlyC/CorC family transporter [Dehalococcoidia bacterium]
MSLELYIALLLLCLLLSAFFSSSETAFISLPRYHIEHMIENKVRGARQIAKLVERPDRLLSTILLGNNLAQNAFAALATVLATFYLRPEHAVIVSSISVTIALLVFGEATPKTLAAHHAERLALVFIQPIKFVSWLLMPFVFVLSLIARGFTKIFGGTPTSKLLASEAEIRTMISVVHKEGNIEESQAEMLHAVFDFAKRPVREVMTPRLEVVGIEESKTIGDFLSLYTEHPFSRFPVFSENMDNIVGVISIKDVLMSLAKNAASSDSSINDLIRLAYFTPETKPINDLFADMRENNYHLAVVVDEHGGTAGIVSSSGLMQEIVGPVGDELAAAAKDFEAINETTFQVDGGMRIEEANEEMGIKLPLGDYETVAGFILHLLGRIPKEGERIRYKDIKVVVTKMRGLKIEEVLLSKEGSIQKKDAAPAG